MRTATSTYWSNARFRALALSAAACITAFAPLAFGADPAKATPGGSTAGSASAEEVQQSAARIEADVRFLADDLLEGREAGTRGFDLAALYVATQYRLAGLQPAGEQGGFFQTVPMLRGVRERASARFAITRDGTTTELKFEEEFLPSLDYATGECSLTAPMVFVGQGVVAPELGHDDFAGVDLRGKVAVMLTNAPPAFSS
ncbi:MAG: aminopeptidase, partial [Steroidobacteraceae bacterium]